MTKTKILLVIAMTLLALWPGMCLAETGEDAEDFSSFEELVELSARFGKADTPETRAKLRIALVDFEWENWELQDALATVQVVLASSNVRDDLSAPPEPTGDELFDRLAALIDSNLEAELSEARYWGFSELVQEDVIASWEGDFGNDPRYWELRYLLANSLTPEAFGMEGWKREFYYAKAEHANGMLKEAIDRGIARPVTLYLYYISLRDLHYQQMEKLLPGPSLTTSYSQERVTHIPPRPDTDPALLEQTRQLRSKQEAEQLAVLNELVDSAPQMAWAHYARAMYWLELGELGKGLANLKSGNAAMDGVIPHGFPIGVALAGLGEDHPRGNAAVTAVLIGERKKLQMFESKDRVKESILVAMLSGDLSLANEWMHFSCRLVRDNPGLVYEWLATIVHFILINTSLQHEYSTALAPGQQAVLEHMLGAVDEAYILFRDKVLDTSSLDSLGVLLVVGGTKGEYVSNYIYMYYDYQTYQQATPIVNDIALIDLTTLNLPPELEKYDRLTPEGRRLRFRLDRAARAVGKQTDAAASEIAAHAQPVKGTAN